MWEESRKLFFQDHQCCSPYKDDKALFDCILKAPEVFKDFDRDSDLYKKHLDKFSVKSMVSRFEEIISDVAEEAEGNKLQAD